jgi:hypothetical protein
MKHEFWTIAYRSRGEKTILEDTSRPFRVIPNTWRYWGADPHLFEENGKTWVFAELYDRVLRRGVIGCSEITPSGATKWKVCLKTPFHLSYPHIFRDGKEIYMIPESYVGEEIGLYRAVEFPYRWERVEAIKEAFVAVDTTRIPWNDRIWLLTQALVDDASILTLMTQDGTQSWAIDRNNPTTRPAGPVFSHGDMLLRPAQDCTDGYGRAIRFNEILEVGEGVYRERLWKEIRPADITSNLKFPAEGIHTYGQTDEYEIIDLKGFERDPLFTITRPIWFIWRRVKRIFVRN